MAVKHSEVLPNAIVYKYNKYIQVNGTLFYAFEYLLKTLESNPSANIKWYIIVPTSLKIDYLAKLEALFRTKYPLWKTKIFRDRQYYENAKEKLTKIEYSQLLARISLLQLAFSKIKVVSGLSLLRKDFCTVLFPCYDSWLNTKVNAEKVIVFQNRKVQNNSGKLDFPDTGLPTVFLYETLPQKPDTTLPNYALEQYHLKLAFDYMLPSKLFIGDQTNKIIAGEPITNIASYQELAKPSLFFQINDRKQFLNTKQIEYHQNFLRFEENTRIIPEAKYYNIPIKVIKVQTKDQIKDINNISISTDYENLPEDSSVPRLTNDYTHYTLTIGDSVPTLLSLC